MTKTLPTLREFAESAGFQLVDDAEPQWGGRFGYRANPNTRVLGFKTEKAAMNAWLSETFGEQPAKALRKLLVQRP